MSDASTKPEVTPEMAPVTPEATSATPEAASVAVEAAHATPKGGPRRAAVIFIFATALMDVISLGIMIPVLPNLVKQFAGGDTALAAQYTIAFSVTWGLMQFFFGPIVGMLSDRFGRRPVLLISIFGLGVDYIFMALAPTLRWLFVGR